jgi:hypothetical protein
MSIFDGSVKFFLYFIFFLDSQYFADLLIIDLAYIVSLTHTHKNKNKKTKKQKTKKSDDLISFVLRVSLFFLFILLHNGRPTL